ncbi:MAG: energy transducer TonB [Gemmatimonadaceae bacterium]
MFDLLQHPPVSPERTPVAPAVSIAAHAVLVIALALGTSQAVLETEPGRESIIESALKYMMPPDKKAALPSEGRARWVEQRAGPLPGAGIATGTPVPRRTGGQAAQDVDGGAPVPLSEAAAAQDAFTLFDVDSAATRDPESAAPAYPPLLEAQGIEGMAVVRFVVDSTGRADLSSYQLVETNHPLFGAAVRAALPGMKFVPARIGAKKVRQLVELPFAFRILKRAEPVPAPVKKP